MKKYILRKWKGLKNAKEYEDIVVFWLLFHYYIVECLSVIKKIKIKINERNSLTITDD